MSTDRNLRLQVVLQAIDKATAPLRSINRGSKDAARALRATLDELKQLKQQQAAIGEFRTLQGAVKASAEQLKAMRLRVAELKAAHVADADAAKVHARELAAAERAVARGSKAYEGQLQTMSRLRERLANLGIKNVAADERRLAEALAATSARADQQRAKASQLGETWKRTHQHRRAYEGSLAAAGKLAAGGAVATGAGTVAGLPVVTSLKDASSLEDAMLGIARQVPGARDDAGRLTAIYAALKEQVHSLGREIPLATDRLAEMMAAGARMEVPTDALADYTRSAAMMALAFDAVPAEIAEAMGKVGKNFKIPVTQIQGLADAINYLDDNAISKGGEIIDVLNRVSGVVSTVKMSATDAAALASTLLTLGERPETAATAINAITQKLAAATKGTKKFQQAVNEIGLDSGAIQQGMATDATSTLLQIIEAIGKLPQSKRVGVMVELVGMEHSDTLAKLVDKPDEFDRQRQLTTAPGSKGSMRREFEARNDTMSARLQTTRNRTYELSTALGESLRPSLIGIMQSVNGVLERLAAWAKEHPQLTTALMQGAAAIAVVLAVVGSLLLAVAGILGPLAAFRFGFATALPLLEVIGVALAAVAAAVGLPVWALGALVAAFAAAAVAVVAYWEPIKAFFAQLWEGVRKIFWDAVDALLEPLRLLRTGLNTIGWNVPEIPRFSTSPVKVDGRPPLPAGAGMPQPMTVAAGPTTVQVQAAPGMDERALAREVARQMDQRDRDLVARGRSALRDRD